MCWCRLSAVRACRAVCLLRRNYVQKNTRPEHPSARGPHSGVGQSPEGTWPEEESGTSVPGLASPESTQLGYKALVVGRMSRAALLRGLPTWTLCGIFKTCPAALCSSSPSRPVKATLSSVERGQRDHQALSSGAAIRIVLRDDQPRASYAASTRLVLSHRSLSVKKMIDFIQNRPKIMLCLIKQKTMICVIYLVGGVRNKSHFALDRQVT